MPIRLIALAVAVTIAVATGAALGARGASPRRPRQIQATAPLYGVTVDDIGTLSSIVPALRALPERPTTRIYFDVHRPASYYATAVKQIGAVGPVIGELLDSSDERAISTSAFQTRVESYLHSLGSAVQIWEIGNEVNGNWTGAYATVAAKLTEAYHDVAAAGGQTALTFYANNFGPDNCGDGTAELTPLQFARKYVPATVADGLDYVFLSYYPTQCAGREPTAAQVASSERQLHALFPRAQLGFGEMGLPSPVTSSTIPRAKQIMRWAYALDPGLPYYDGGYFWWYAAQDALHAGAPLAKSLAAAFRSEALTLSGGGRRLAPMR